MEKYLKSLCSLSPQDRAIIEDYILVSKRIQENEKEKEGLLIERARILNELCCSLKDLPNTQQTLRLISALNGKPKGTS